MPVSHDRAFSRGHPGASALVVMIFAALACGQANSVDAPAPVPVMDGAVDSHPPHPPSLVVAPITKEVAENMAGRAPGGCVLRPMTPSAACYSTMPGVASYAVNPDAVAQAERLIEARQYVLDSEWGEVQPKAADENAYLESHSWEEYAAWHLGLTEGAPDGTKARYGFVYGDFRRLHRTGLIACVYRAASWRHKDVELAAHELLQLLDRTSG